MVKDHQEAFEKIKRNTQEIVSEPELLQVLQKDKVTAYWGTAPTGQIHTGYLIPMSKIADFLDVGVEFTILLANLHAHLDDMKSPFDLLKYRTEYYKEVILGLLEGLSVDVSKLKFIVGTDFELSEKYALELLKLSSVVTFNRSKRAGAEVVRQKDDPKLGSFLYPLMQSLDVPHLECDIAFGGIDQRGIYMLSREIVPILGYNKPICVFNPMLPGLTGGKMSASDESSKINVLDTIKQVKKKVNKSFCPEKEVEGNTVLSFCKTVIFPFLERKGELYVINRHEKYGDKITYSSYIELEQDFVQGALHPADLKLGTGDYTNALLEPVRKRFSKNPELLKQAYPKSK
ncbi:MAG: tyrosine--tRNA ligase [Candidatus Kariarchaeaceae archaeon]|jgi:tyrosyl-tRNA synthetase